MPDECVFCERIERATGCTCRGPGRRKRAGMGRGKEGRQDAESEADRVEPCRGRATQRLHPEMPARPAGLTPAERFGRRVAMARAARDWSMRGLCMKAGIPSASTIDRIEDGSSVSLDTAARVARALGLSLDGLLDPCRQCQDAPPPGFTCNACGAESGQLGQEETAP